MTHTTNTDDLRQSLGLEPLPDPELRPTVSVDEAAAWLDLSRGAAYEGVRSGDIPAIRVGRRWLIPTAALRQMLGLAGDPEAGR